MTLKLRLGAGLWLACLTGPALPAPGLANLELDGLLDLRAAPVNASQYSNNEDFRLQAQNRRHYFLGQASLDLRYQPSLQWQLDSLLDYNPEASPGLGLIEAKARWRGLPRQGYRQQLTLGIFYPDISWEHLGPGWSSLYNLTPSAMNSWVGEELRLTGLRWELQQLGRQRQSPWDWSLAMSLFGNNDAAGSFLAWRGFGMHNRQTGINQHLSLPDDLPAFQSGYALGQHATQVQPMQELDDRLGWNLGLSSRYQDTWRAQWGYYDNAGDPNVFKAGEYGWRTRFSYLGLAYEQDGWLLQAQQMRGSSRMNDRLGDPATWYDLYAGYGLASYHWQAHRLSLRYDRFWLADRDGVPLDDNSETGKAWTASYLYQWDQHWQLGLESVWLMHQRAVRRWQDEPGEQQNRLWQLALRYRL